MCFVPKLNSNRLANALEEYLQKEDGDSIDVRRVFHSILRTEGNEITPSIYSNTTRWIWLLNQDFEYLPDTFSLTISLLNRFLSLVKAKPRYLCCIAITCYFLAIKTVEEDESIPSLSELVQVSECGCSVSDVLRMERIILTKLQWNLTPVTALHFLYLYEALVLPDSAFGGMAPRQHMNMMTIKLDDCLCNVNFTQFKVSVLALAIFSQELESLSPSGWLAAVIKLQKLTRVEFGDLIRCRELLHSTFGVETQKAATRKSRETKRFFHQSLATIPEGVEELSVILPDHLHTDKPVPIEANSDSCEFEGAAMRDELKRLSSMVEGILSDEDCMPAPKRRRSEKPLPCGLQSQLRCGICNSGVQAIQAIAL